MKYVLPMLISSLFFSINSMCMKTTAIRRQFFGIKPSMHPAAWPDIFSAGKQAPIRPYRPIENLLQEIAAERKTPYILDAPIFYEGEYIPPLHLAAQVGNLTLAHRFIDTGANPDIDYKGRRPVDTAIIHNRPYFVALLMRAGVKLNDHNQCGKTPLHTAAAWNRARIAYGLIANGADLNSQSMGEELTPLHTAAYQGSPNIAKLLLQYGARKKQLDKRGYSAAQWAIKCSNQEVLDIIEKHAATTKQKPQL